MVYKSFIKKKSENDYLKPVRFGGNSFFIKGNLKKFEKILALRPWEGFQIVPRHIGQKKQYLKSRIYEHKYSFKTENSECSNSTNPGHNFDFSSPKIINREIKNNNNSFRNDEF